MHWPSETAVLVHERAAREKGGPTGPEFGAQTAVLKLKNAFIAHSGGLNSRPITYPGRFLVTEPGVDDFVEVALQLTARDEARARTRRRLALELGGSFHGAFMHGGSVDAPSVAQLP